MQDNTEIENGQGSFHSSSIQVSGPDYTGLDHVDVIQLLEPANCLRCTGLLSMSKREATYIQNIWGMPLLDHNAMLCHYSKGSTQCPAASVRIIKHADLDKAVNEYIKALDSGNAKRLSIITEAINQKDDSTSALVMARIKDVLDSRRHIPMVEDKTPTTTESVEPIAEVAKTEEDVLIDLSDTDNNK